MYLWRKGRRFPRGAFYGIIAVFVAGLMVGRTPEFLGKKIEKAEIILVSLVLADPSARHPGAHRLVGRRALRARIDGQCRSARIFRSPLCLCIFGREQRLGVCRAQRQCALV